MNYSIEVDNRGLNPQEFQNKCTILSSELNEKVASQGNGYSMDNYYTKNKVVLRFQGIINKKQFRRDFDEKINKSNMLTLTYSFNEYSISPYDSPDIYYAHLFIELRNKTRKNIGYLNGLNIYRDKGNVKYVKPSYDKINHKANIILYYVSDVNSFMKFMNQLDAVDGFRCKYTLYDDSKKIMYKGDLHKQRGLYSGYLCDGIGILYTEFKDVHISEATDQILDIFSFH